MKRGLAKLLIPFLVLLNCPVQASQGTDGEVAGPSTQVVHKPAKELEAGRRVAIYAEVEDAKGIDLVRVYFKAAEGAHYNFVPMAPAEKAEKGMYEKFKQLGSDFNGDAYTATLPAPANGCKSLEYLLLVKNNDNVIVKTQTYTVPVKDSDQKQEGAAPIEVYTEMTDVPTEMTGFADNMTFDVVESTAKFGVVAGLYPSIASGAEGATSGGTIAASSGGFTTTAAVVAGAAAVAVIGGVAVAGGGSGGSGGGGETLTSQNIIGTWSVTETFPGGYSTSYHITFYNNGRYSIPENNLPGSWRLVGNTLTINPDHGGAWSGTVSGNSNSFSVTGDTTVRFTR